MQQARDLRAEETVEVVRNHEDGTGFTEPDAPWTETAAMRWEWTLGGSHLRRTELCGRPHGDGGGGSVEGRFRRSPRAFRSNPGCRWLARRIPREEVGESDPGGRTEALEGNQGPEGPHGDTNREGSEAGAAPSEDLEDPRGDTQGQGGSGEGPTTRYDHAAEPHVHPIIRVMASRP
jgi:hypothetical protein